MGGFRLLGPNYTIQSLPSEVMCKCMGFKGEINEEQEQKLVNNPEKRLSKFPVPRNGAHIGDNMHYKVIHKSEDNGFVAERERFRNNKAKQKKRYNTWKSPWDGLTLESIATRELN